MIWLGVALAGALGALGRVSIDRRTATRSPGRRARGLPVGILLVNVSGSLALGVLVGAGVHGDDLKLAGTALLGSYTTFSTWMLDAVEQRAGLAAANIGLSAVLGLAAVAIGRALA